jgi:hypothetical protein
MWLGRVECGLVAPTRIRDPLSHGFWNLLLWTKRDSHGIILGFLYLNLNGGAPKVGGAVDEGTIDSQRGDLV